MSKPLSSRIALLAVFCSWLISACTSGPTYPPTTTAPQIPVEDHSQGASSGSSAEATTNDDNSSPTAAANPGKTNVTLALLEKSATAQSAGNTQQAVTYIERAIRINPRQADLWIQLAQLQLTMGQPQAALDYAQKAITLAGTRMDWQRDAWLVIADAKAAQGHTQEALAIRQRWQTGRG